MRKRGTEAALAAQDFTDELNAALPEGAQKQERRPHICWKCKTALIQLINEKPGENGEMIPLEDGPKWKCTDPKCGFECPARTSARDILKPAKDVELPDFETSEGALKEFIKIYMTAEAIARGKGGKHAPKSLPLAQVKGLECMLKALTGALTIQGKGAIEEDDLIAGMSSEERKDFAADAQALLDKLRKCKVTGGVIPK